MGTDVYAPVVAMQRPEAESDVWVVGRSGLDQDGVSCDASAEVRIAKNAEQALNTSRVLIECLLG
jgi:hypothetical protein